MFRVVLFAALLAAIAGMRVQDTSTWLDDFHVWAVDNCQSCITVFGPLFKGIHEQGFIKTGDFHELRKPKLRFTLNNTLYGDFARNSKIPFVLKIDKDVTVSFEKELSAPEKWIASIKGLHTQPARAGHRMYETIIQGRDECPIDVTQECIAKEIAAVKRYYKLWCVENHDVISHIFGSLDAVTKRVVGSESMSHALYLMITSCGLTLNSIVFEGEKVYAKTEVDYEGDGAEFCVEHGLPKKSDLLGKLALSQHMASLAIVVVDKYDMTGLNFLKLLYFGNEVIRDILQDHNVPASSPSSIGDAFTLCETLDHGGRPSCEGSTRGRIHWSEQLNYEFA